MTATITVVNVRTDPGPFTYVGRRTHGYGGSPLGNPHPIGRTCPICHARHGRGDAIAAYRTWLAEQMAAGPGNPAHDQILRLARYAASGRPLRLACWCSPAPCHADVIKEEVERVLAAVAA